MSIFSGIKDMGRVSHVLNVLFKNGLGYFLKNYGLTFHLPFIKKIAFHKFKKPVSPEVKLRKALEELGGTYVKLGQMLSLRPDLVPKEFSVEFAKLQDKVPPIAYSKIKSIVELELGKPLNKIFKSFNATPIGSASIGQVHVATLKNGKKVVVKVQRPNINAIFRTDIDIMHYLAKQLMKTKSFGKYSPMNIVNEFERYTKNELNYLIEARNIEKFYDNLEKLKNVKIPKLYTDYTTSKILVMEFIDGEKLSTIIREKKKISTEKVMKLILSACLKQVFENNIFHADLHPGNILVLKDGSIALLDFGIVGGLSPYLRKEGVNLYVNLVNKNIEGVTNQLLKIGKITADTNLDDFKREVDEIVSGWHGKELRQVRVTHMLHQLFDSCINHHIEMPVDMILLGKALLTVEGTCMMLNPRFNFVKESHDYVGNYVKKKAISRESFENFLLRSREIANTLEMIPSEALSVLEKIKRGVVKIDIEDTDLKRLALDIDRSSNRLSYSLIMAALVVSAAMMTMSGAAPVYRGISIPALIFYAIAGVMGLTLFVSIMREGTVWR